MHFTLITPSQQVASLTVTYVNIPGESGDFGVLPGHMPLVSTLRDESHLQVTSADGHIHTYTLTGGIADVQPNAITILAASATAA